jgi:NCAIR mutase (PurE)-related protein
MDPHALTELLGRVARGEIDVDEAGRKLRAPPIEDLGYATVDHHRALRQGAPEVIFGEGKTAEQILGIARSIVRHGRVCLVTRIAKEKAERVVTGLLEEGPADPAPLEIRHVEIARTLIAHRGPIAPRGSGAIAVIAAGTSDLPVAEEACETLAALGRRVHRMYDVGVAGLHRLLNRLHELEDAKVLIVVAGMEGALPSVVGGLTDKPIIGVPTSIGYGSALGGLTPMLAMLTSCASGITVVNIDNGFGAAFAAARIDR